MGANYTGPVNPLLFNNFNCDIAYGPLSLRNVGHEYDISTSTISLFGSTYLSGNMTQYSTDVPNFAGAFSSVAVTQPAEATFYTVPNYEGLSICLKARANSGEAYYTFDLNELGIVPGQIKSMRFGCHSNNIFYSSTVTVKQ